MRDYGKVASTFWTGHTGRLLRDDRDSQVVAMYLLTGPLANMIGLYHLPIALLSDHTGIPFKGALKALQRVCDVGFCRFEGVLEHVFVPEMAAYQVGEPLKREDKRVTGIIAQWQTYRKSPFYIDFHARYASSYHLPEPSPIQGASKPHRSQEQEQEQEREQESGAGTDIATGGEAPPPPVEQKIRVRLPDQLWDAIVEVTGTDASIKSNASHVGKVKKELLGASPPYTHEDVLSLPGIAAVHLPWSAGRALTLGELQKNIGLVRSHPPKVSANGKARTAMEEFLARGEEK